MTTVTVPSLKIAYMFTAGNLPEVDPSDPRFTIALGPATIEVRINRKAAARLSAHHGGAVLQGRLTAGPNNTLVPAEAGFTWLEPRPAHPAARGPAGQGGTDHVATEPRTEAH